MKERIKNLTHLLGFFVLGVALIAVYKTFDNFQIIWDFIRKFMIKCSLRKNFCW